MRHSRRPSPNSSNGNLLTVNCRPRANSFREMSNRLTVNGKSTPVVKVSCFNESSKKSIVRRSGSLTPSPSVHSYKKRGSFRASDGKKSSDKLAAAKPESDSVDEGDRLLPKLPTSKSSSLIKNKS